ncbi:MAG TPA: anti-sigma factor [Acidimicrobiales bacterium]|nr:anti-sigma factor [Acidimicrobiales bacterium]
MITHDEASALLASFALDAVEDEEQRQVEAHLATCRRCRSELDAMREVAAAMGNSVETLPEGLWSSIAGCLPERGDAEPPPMPRLMAGDRATYGAPGTRGGRRPIRGPVGALALAATAVAAVLGVGLVRADDRVAHYASLARVGAAGTVAAALSTAGHQMVNLETADHVQLARFVVVPDGRGYLVASSLPALGSHHTYQLWGTIGHQPISLGLLGRSPRQATFTVAGTAPLSKLSVTVEPAGGSVAPSGQAVASGAV